LFGRNAGEAFVMIVEADGFVRPKPVEFTAGKRMPPIEIELTPAAPATIRGRVVDADGKPVAGAAVGLSKELFGNHKDEPWRYLGDNKLPTTDADGRFTIPGVAVGTRFAVRSGRSGCNRPESDWRTADKPGDIVLPDLVIRPGAAVLTGAVVDPAGRPIGGARVSQLDRFGQVEAVTEADGTFRLEGLADGTVYLQVKADDYELKNHAAKAGATNIRITMNRPE
jgi:hypothetical protein